MSIRAHLSLGLLLALLAAVGLGAGCGDADEKDSAADLERTTSDPSTERRGRSPARGREEKGKRRGTPRQEREDARRERRDEKELDRGFRKTSFEKLVDRLPLREPPLHVEQYILTEGSHTVYTGVRPKRFFCGRTPAQRKEAVEAFYRDADRELRRGGVRDFVLVVTPATETAEELPALAKAEKGSVSLTPRGRGKGPC